MTLKLLFVDDDSQQRKILKDALESFSKKTEITIFLDESDNLEEGLNKLKQQNYDAAIVDLRLDKTDTDGKGNQLITQIKNNLRFPLRVVSGHLGDLNEELQTKSFFYDYYSRDDVDYELIFNDFCNIYSTGITQILNNRGRIDSNITTIFWKHISEILPEFIREKREKPEWDVEKVLLRYISSHILEYLEISIDNNLEPVHSIEFYIRPSIKNKIFTGDILKKKSDSTYWVVITPVCDLATDEKRTVPKAEYVTIVSVKNYDEIVNGRNAGDINKLKSNNLDLKFHYLPQSILFNGGFINFQCVNSVLTVELIEEYDMELVITNSFRKDIISRFSNYYSRQGQPVFMRD